MLLCRRVQIFRLQPCCAGTTRALKSNSSTPKSIAVIFFFFGDRIILIFHFTQNDSLTFPRQCCFWEALRSISHNEQLATIMLQQSHYYVE